MKRQLDLDADLRDVEAWLMGESHSASGDMKAKLRALWWAYQEARDRSESMTAILVAAAAKSLDLRKPDAGGPEAPNVADKRHGTVLRDGSA